LRAEASQKVLQGTEYRRQANARFDYRAGWLVNLEEPGVSLGVAGNFVHYCACLKFLAIFERTRFQAIAASLDTYSFLISEEMTCYKAFSPISSDIPAYLLQIAPRDHLQDLSQSNWSPQGV
jgi:hypothetical protein